MFYLRLVTWYHYVVLPVGLILPPPALVVRIRPDAYTIGPQTIGARSQMDPKFSNSELEWSTKRRGVAVLVGLLVKVEGVDQETDTGTLAQAAAMESGLPQGVYIIFILTNALYFYMQ